jgi:hypothetical protein
MSRFYRVLIILLFAAPVTIFAQANLTSTGDWNVAGNWASGNIGDGGENVTTDANRSPTVPSGYSTTIGSMAANGDLFISSGGTLTLGTSTLFNAGTDRNLTFANNSTLSVGGTLEIWGDLILNNVLALTITGNMIVHGDVIMNNGGNLSVSGAGTLTIGGNLTGSNNTQITTAGGATIAVGGSISLGGGTSSISGPNGSISVGGSCTCTGCGSGCPSTVLPVELLYFTVHPQGNKVELKWATTMEENFSKFVIQRAEQGSDFIDLAEVAGKGENTYDLITKYSYTDKAPVVGFNYYRLKAVDLDYSEEYFAVKSAKIEGEKAIGIFPNPSRGASVSIVTNFAPSAGDKVRLLNSFGVEVLTRSVVTNNIILEGGNNLLPGVYFLQYAGNSHNQTIRFIVEK